MLAGEEEKLALGIFHSVTANTSGRECTVSLAEAWERDVWGARGNNSLMRPTHTLHSQTAPSPRRGGAASGLRATWKSLVALLVWRC